MNTNSTFKFYLRGLLIPLMAIFIGLININLVFSSDHHGGKHGKDDQGDHHHDKNHPKKKFFPPDEKGPYNVGFTTFCAEVNPPPNPPMSPPRVTRIQVYYPTLDPPNCQTKYQVFSRPTAALPIPNLASCFPNEAPNNTYFLSSALCAVQNAVVAPGPFPLIVHDHGGGVAGSDFQRYNQLPVQEAMASQGFILVSPTHSANAVNRVLDLSLIIDTLLARNATGGDALFGRIDPERIGISGLSAGGQAALLTVSGSAANGIAADPRLKAMVVYEPVSPASLAPIINDVSTISIPYLVMGGDQFAGGLEAISVWFDLTTLATPRIFVLNPTAAHHGYQTGSCLTIDEAREYALANDPSLRDPITGEIIIEPLTNLITNPNTGRRSCNPAMGTAGANACGQWNQGEIQFFANNPNFGGGRNLCNRVGTRVNSIRSLDMNPKDTFTDATDPTFTDSNGNPIPLFEANDAFIAEAPIPAEILVPMVKLYTVAFWQKFLAGKGQYMRYLTPGYANRHDLMAIVEIVDDEADDEDDDGAHDDDDN